MTKFFAACTSDILFVFQFFYIFLLIAVGILIILRLVLAELTARLLFALFTAAPPHDIAILALMLPATPVKVFLLRELFIAVLARLQT